MVSRASLRRRSRRSALVADWDATPPPPNLEPALFWEGGVSEVVVEWSGYVYLVVHCEVCGGVCGGFDPDVQEKIEVPSLEGQAPNFRAEAGRKASIRAADPSAPCCICGGPSSISQWGFQSVI